jgi:hypothetical protein
LTFRPAVMDSEAGLSQEYEGRPLSLMCTMSANIRAASVSRRLIDKLALD